MVAPNAQGDRKEQIVSAAIDRLFAVGFEGFRIGDVAKDVGINNATLIHHYPSKVELIKAVIGRFTTRFEAVSEPSNTEGTPRDRLTRHMRSSVELMRTAPQMFAVLNEIMIKARRDPDIYALVSVPLEAWRNHIVSLVASPAKHADKRAGNSSEEIAGACMAQLLGLGLLAGSPTDSNYLVDRDRVASRAIAALTHLVGRSTIDGQADDASR